MDIWSSTGAFTREDYVISLKAIKGNQFKKVVYAAQTDVQTLLKFFEIDPDVQRDLNHERIGGIVRYIHNSLRSEDQNLYFPPFILSARKKGKFIENESLFKLKTNDKLYVLDGQHRLKALQEANSLIEDPTITQKLREFPVTLQIYADLTQEQEQQLFSDVNSKATRVGANLIKVYSQNDPTAGVMREIVYGHPTISSREFEMRRNQTRTKLMTGLNVYKIIAMLDSGREIPNNENYKIKGERIKQTTMYFLECLMNSAPINAYDRKSSIYLNQGVLLGIAKVAHETPIEEWKTKLFKVVKDYDWTQTNRELESYGVPYTIEKSKYRLNPPSKVRSAVYEIIKNKLNELS